VPLASSTIDVGPQHEEAGGMTSDDRPAQQAVRRCAVLGSPIAHSLSPTLHMAAYHHLGLPWDYGRHEVDESTFGDFLAGLDATWRGLSLTMPL
jgi:shikimate dehydrogenase